jgi:hypothetical protein
MESFTGARDLRNLLAVAIKLRHLANDTLCQGDRSLYLMAADALEKRARWLAAALPEEHNVQNVDPTPPLPVDLII